MTWVWELQELTQSETLVMLSLAQGRAHQLHKKDRSPKSVAHSCKPPPSFTTHFVPVIAHEPAHFADSLSPAPLRGLQGGTRTCGHRRGSGRALPLTFTSQHAQEAVGR